MAQTGKKINELAAITTVSDETVLPAVYVSGGNPSSTANKVSIEQISNKITNDLSTILNSKQDKLTAGDNITIESNVISATDTKYTAGTNITISEQNVISADVDALPSQTGQSGKFLTTDGTDASWAEVNIPNNVWTQDNLKAGNNVTITQIQKPVIDENTVSLFHFDETVKDEISGDNADVSSYHSFVDGKFGKAMQMDPTREVYVQITPSFKLTDGNYTLDYWAKAPTGRTSIILEFASSIGSTSDYNYFIQLSSNTGIFVGRQLSGTSSPFENSDISAISSIYNFFHIAYVVDKDNLKVYLFLNGTKVMENTLTAAYIGGNATYLFRANGIVDEVRLSNTVRWTSNFTPYTLPYAPAGGTTQYQINATVPQGGSAPTLTWYTGNTGTTVTIADTTSASLVKVYKNGILLQPIEDYSISGTTLTLVSALESQDKITTEVFA